MLNSVKTKTSKLISYFRRMKPMGVNSNGLEVFFDRKRMRKCVKVAPQDTESLQPFVNQLVKNLEKGHGLILVNESKGFYYLEEQLYTNVVAEMFRQKALKEQPSEGVEEDV